MMLTLAAVLWMMGSPMAAPPYYNVYPLPKMYDYQPRKRMTLYEMSPLGVILHCGLAYACTQVYPDHCVFYMPTGQSAYYWRHEREHCNGWDPSHPYPLKGDRSWIAPRSSKRR